MEPETSVPPGDPVPARPPSEVPGEESSPNRAPNPDELLNEWRWIYQQRETEAFRKYRGRHVAVCGQKVWGSSTDPTLLLEHVALKYGLDPRKVVVAYIDGPF
jgi:hypothetical protein